MFIRFQGLMPNLGTESRLGMVQLAAGLRDADDTPLYAANEMAAHMSWLNDNMRAPSILRKVGYIRAICWLKPAAKEPLAHFWAMKTMQEDFGYAIDDVKTKHPGLIVYEDGGQVAAKPWRNS